MVQRFRIELGVASVLLAAASVAPCQDHGAVVSGVVRDGHGVPQMGALVQVLSPDSSVRATAFTDLQGRYRVARLLPGLYGVRASASLYLPASREHLQLRPDHRAIVDLTLSGLFDKASWLPARAKGADEASDDWSWTLRSSASRPLLKLADEDSPGRDEGAKKTLGGLTFTAPSGEFGHGVSRAGARAGRLTSRGSAIAVTTEVGTRAAGDSAQMPLHASSRLERSLGLAGAVAARVDYADHPEIVGSRGGAGLRVIAISSAERFGVGDFGEIEAGNRAEAVMGSVPVLVNRPFVRVSAHPAEPWTVTYSLASSPDTQDYDSALMREAELPTVSTLAGFTGTDRGMHQEVGLTHRTSSTLLQLSYFVDALDRVVLSGVGGDAGRAELPELGPAVSGLLVDQSNGSFRALAQGYHGSGVNVLLTRAVGSGTWVALQYCTGSAVGLTDIPDVAQASGARLRARRGQAATVTVKTGIARTRTRARATYRWQSDGLVTSVNPYDLLAGGNYLSVHVRQPISWTGLLPEGMEMTLDGANVLRQGYQQVGGRGGRPLFLAASPASLQAGLAFTF